MNVSSSNTPTTASFRMPLPRVLAFWLVLLLSLQFVLGMVTNLYVTIPARHPGSDAAEYFGGVVAGVIWSITEGAWALRIHALLGLLIILAAATLVGAAISRRRRMWIVCSIIAVLFTIAAGFNGASFLNYREDFSSLFMSLGFAVALVALLVGLYLDPADRGDTEDGKPLRHR
jgi:hypothetical protein